MGPPQKSPFFKRNFFEEKVCNSMLRDCTINIQELIFVKKMSTATSIDSSDMTSLAVCFQIDPESYEWGLSARSVNLWCMWEHHR